MDGFVVVYRAYGMPEAELIKGYLESGDIPVELDYESAGQVYGFTMDGLGEVRVCVPEENEEEARAALASRPSLIDSPNESTDADGPDAA